MNNNADPSRFREFINRSVVVATLLAGSVAVTSCTAETPQTTPSPSATEVSPVSPAPADIYTGSVLELVATPIVSGPIGEEKDKAINISFAVSSVAIDETTIPAMVKARKLASSLPDSLIVYDTNLAIDANAANAIVTETYPAPTTDVTSTIESKKLLSQEKDVINHIMNVDLRKATNGVLDYELAKAALAAGVSSPDTAAQQKALISLIKNPAIRKETVDTIAAISTTGVDNLTPDINKAESSVSTYYGIATSAIEDGSAEQAASINAEINAYQHNLGKDKSETWLKDIGIKIVDSMNAQDSVFSADTIKATQLRAKKIPNTDVRTKTSQAIDNTIASRLQQFETTSYTDIDVVKQTINDDNNFKNQIMNPDEKKQVTTMLDYFRAQSAIDSADPDISAYLLGAITDPKIKREAQAVHGGGDPTNFKTESDAALALLSDRMTSPEANLYNGSNGQAKDINTKFTTYNTAASNDGH